MANGRRDGGEKRGDHPIDQQPGDEEVQALKSMKACLVVVAAVTACILLFAPVARGQYKSVNPRVTDAVSQVSEKRITAILKKLESFGTRNIMSADDDPARGIGAARSWILQEFQNLSPR